VQNITQNMPKKQYKKAGYIVTCNHE